MRSICVATVLAAAAMAALAQQPGETADSRIFWRYVPEVGDGYFRRLPNGKWEEIGNAQGKLMGTWEELSRTPEYVELYDPKRNYKTRLGAGKAWITSGRDSTAFGPSPAGNWERPGAAPTVPQAAKAPQPAKATGGRENPDYE